MYNYYNLSRTHVVCQILLKSTKLCSTEFQRTNWTSIRLLKITESFDWRRLIYKKIRCNVRMCIWVAVIRRGLPLQWTTEMLAETRLVLIVQHRGEFCSQEASEESRSFLNSNLIRHICRDNQIKIDKWRSFSLVVWINSRLVPTLLQICWLELGKKSLIQIIIYGPIIETYWRTEM